LAALQYLGRGERDLGVEEKFIIYDALILSFENLDSAASIASSIRKEAIAIQSALKLLCDEKYNEVLSALRPVGLHSSFSHWKLFIRLINLTQQNYYPRLCVNDLIF